MRFMFAVATVFMCVADLSRPVLALEPDDSTGAGLRNRGIEELRRNADPARRLAFVAEYIRELRNRGVKDPPRSAEPARRAFVAEYIRQLGVNDRLGREREKEVAGAADPSVAIIRSNMRIVAELTAQKGFLKGITFSEPLAAVPGNIGDLYTQLIAVHNKFIALGAAMGSASTRARYEALAAEAPQLAAWIDQIDRALFDAAPLIFAVLIVDKADDDGQMRRLSITREERDRLVRSLQNSFGDRIGRADQSYLVRSASLFRDFLTKLGYRCADEFLR